MLFPLLTKK